MKSKKTAFANTSTGYGRHKSGLNRNHNNNNNNNNHNKNSKTDNKEKKNEKPKIDLEEKLESDKDLNSGFGDYLRTPEAVEMMKLFVFANTIMLIVTMAWPNIREQYYWARQWWEETFQQE